MYNNLYERCCQAEGLHQLKLRQLNRVVTRHYDAYMAVTGLKNTQYSLLSHVVLQGRSAHPIWRGPCAWRRRR